MSTLKTIEKTQLEDLFGMRSGYVLDLTNRKFEEILRESAGVEINAEKYAGHGSSKANRLRAFWELEQDALVGRALAELVEHWEYNNPQPSNENLKLSVNCKRIVERLLGNHGIALHDLSVSLRFHAKGGGGTFYIPLNRLDDPGFIHAEFARGMTESFGLKSYQLDAGQTSIILALEDPKTQRATLVIGAGGFCVGKILITGWRDQLACAWNRMGVKLYLKSRRNVGVSPEGIPITMPVINLTPRPNCNIQLANFLGALRHRCAQPSRVPPHG